MPERTHIIVGASLAGASAAVALRKGGFDGRILLIGEESEVPYERPELSKKYLRGESGTDLLVKPESFYAEANVELILGTTVERIDPAAREVITGSGPLRYDRLLIATGAAPRRTDLPGAELDGVLTLRTRGDADEIRQRALEASSVVVVGGGWIGSEVTASLRQLGREVTLITPTRAPLERILGPEVAEVYRRAHEARGVRLVPGTRVARFVGNGSVASVETEDGQTFPAELVVVGIGAEPRTALASEAGLAVDRGIVVDEFLQATIPGIYAAGDAADAWHPYYRRHVRVEHWDNARRQGRAAAANMLGQATTYDRIPYFYSDQYDLGMEYRGFAPHWDEVLFRGAPGHQEFIAFWLRDGAVVAAMNMNVWDVGPAIEQLVRSGQPIDRERLMDPADPLEGMVVLA